MQETTLCLLVRGDPPEEILLGSKSVGFGAGKITGFGGKVEKGETAAMASVRETQEEIGVLVRVEDLRQVARLTFVFPARPAWSQIVHVFLVFEWQGQAVASTEMTPAWFRIEDIPYERMWDDAAHWLPRIVAGERITARFTFKDDNETVGSVKILTWGDASSGTIVDLV